MGKNWTEAQKAAMDTRNKTLLVSAAAGSGKTATLTERIIRRITDKEAPADISKMLIVTFTRAAAAELRSRIFSALGDALAEDPANSHLASQIMKIGSARICTIDAFYLDIIRANFSTLGISAGFRLADDSEYALIARRTMEESIEFMYESDPEFPVFTECFGTVRSSVNIADVFLDLYSSLVSLPEGIEYVRECAQRAYDEAELDFFATSYGKNLRITTKDFCKHYLDIFKAAVIYMQSDEPMQGAYEKSFLYDLEYCQKLYDALCDEKYGYVQTKQLIHSYTPVSLGRLASQNKSDISEQYKNMRADFSKKVKSLAAKAFSKSPEIILRAMRDTSRYLFTLYDLLTKFEATVNDEKSRRSIMTFSDVRRATLKLLVNSDGSPTEIARAYSEQFSDIYIDEYQDVDRVQDLIFSSIARSDNRFMVGDIKQSIYGFRGAEPMLFASYRQSFPPLGSDASSSSDVATVFMSDNFRCDKNVIDFTNQVCSTIFSACSESIGYTREDDLGFSKAIPYEGYVSPKVKVALITAPEENDADGIDVDSNARKAWEAEYIAEEISRLIREEKKADGSPIRPADIAVLFRTKSMSSILAAALDARGIPYSESDGERYFENSDVLMMLCILNTIDNPERDIYLAGALSSPIFNFNIEELIMLRKNAEKSYSLFGALELYSEKFDDALAKKCKDFIIDLRCWQNEAASLSVDRFLRMLFESERFVVSGVVSQTDSRGDGGNLLILYEYARKFENGSFKGLYQFVEYINSVIRDGGKLLSENKISSDNRVSLMTIHKSKGLEFPVCFICNTSASARSQDTKNSLVYEYSAGMAIKVADGSGFARINTPMRDAVIARISDKQMEEEMRVLYVALTRARERLYLTATSSSDETKLIQKAKANSLFTDRYTVMNACTSYFDWVLLALQGKSHESYDLDIIPCDRLRLAQNSSALYSREEKNIDTDLVEKLKNEFSFKYKYSPLSRVPSKLSVSRLYPDILDENDNSLELFTEIDKKAKIPDFFSGIKSSAGAAERGTATHLFLQFCDFERACKFGVNEELARLEEKKFLPSDARSLIYMDELEAFMEGQLIREILDADRIIREQRFNVELPADKFSSDDELISKIAGEHLAVQGVIDLIIVDKSGNISLFDYKTDRLTHNELADDALASRKMNKRHATQLSYYAQAVELLFGKPCSRVCVYSTHSAKLYDIDVKR